MGVCTVKVCRGCGGVLVGVYTVKVCRGCGGVLVGVCAVQCIGGGWGSDEILVCAGGLHCSPEAQGHRPGLLEGERRLYPTVSAQAASMACCRCAVSFLSPTLPHPSRRALELSLALVNENNVRLMVQELLAFLRSDADVEFKPYLASNLILVANK